MSTHPTVNCQLRSGRISFDRRNALRLQHPRLLKLRSLVERTLHDEKPSNLLNLAEQSLQKRLARIRARRMCGYLAEPVGIATGVVTNFKPAATASGQKRGQTCFPAGR